jgi:phage N-6-adenine-methyltransferase
MRRDLSAHFSSDSAEWSTPDDLFRELDEVFHFDLDACASASNCKCERYFSKDDDALVRSWQGTVWMNPPYGRHIERFMRKAYEESIRGATVVCLVPARTDTAWWHRYARKGQVHFLRGRLRFGGAASSAPFPSAVVIFWSGALGVASRPS